jgi:lariat debranching enzyme
MSKTIAIFGDVHGHQDAMVLAAWRWMEEHQANIDLILCVGDFQAIRDETDMRAMACPAKYQQVGDYPAYHMGQRSFPAEVVFIGGNHEAYNWLETMPAGGQLGPKCYYVGRWGVIERLGLRIAGLTGNYSPRAYESGRRPVDYANLAVLANERAKKQSTYFTQAEVQALGAIGHVDILLLHDWPEGLPELAEPGTTDGTPRRGVGNPHARWLLEQLKPRWVFCGHMHHYFRGEIRWSATAVTRFVCLERVTSPASQAMSVLRIGHEADGRPRLGEAKS